MTATNRPTEADRPTRGAQELPPLSVEASVGLATIAAANAWDEGMRCGWSRAMRMMSDEPALGMPTEADNPYRAHVSERSAGRPTTEGGAL